MHDEDGFLAAIRLQPADDTARLVFADWLDERDDPICRAKAAFIRLELRTAEAPEQGLNRIRWTNKLQKLATRLEPAWLAVISHPKLEACRMSFRFACPKQWDRLAPTDVPKVRFCEGCHEHVHFCNSLPEARYHAARGHCVALTLALVRKPNDLIPPGPILAGMPVPPSAFHERLGRAGIGLPFGVANEPEYLLPEPPAAPEWVPAPASAARTERTNRRPKRRGRNRHRNLQRENWEDAE